METKEIKITPPEGYEIDKKNSTFDCIRFKPIIKGAKKWRGSYDAKVSGYLINNYSRLHHWNNLIADEDTINVFATEKQAKSALAMAQISQIMVNDERFGGVVTDEEWANDNIWKHSINRNANKIECSSGTYGIYHFLSFHTEEQRDLFLKENEDLVKDYLMID